jgi:dihydrofolate reductase
VPIANSFALVDAGAFPPSARSDPAAVLDPSPAPKIEYPDGLAASAGSLSTRRKTSRKENLMGKLVVSENVTLDGVVQDPAGAEGFARGGWVGRIGERGREDAAQVLLDEALGAEAQLFGRRTYEFLAARWPSRSGEFADRFNKMPKYVVSSTLKDPDWSNSTVLTGDVVQEVSKLKEELAGGDRRCRQHPARPHAARERPRRRAATDDLSGSARGRRAPLRRDG